ncbi:hypothetical protein EB796_012281 [Bugula neritina]|uniref:Uncharacterized protein n=1 Tax=Bugula neritina TaxID=10212 RepID=A0A7J7JSR4_BUGNE|nr:hypothetical protein EB796_012281 [Bugula neritina]
MLLTKQDFSSVSVHSQCAEFNLLSFRLDLAVSYHRLALPCHTRRHTLCPPVIYLLSSLSRDTVGFRERQNFVNILLNLNMFLAQVTKSVHNISHKELLAQEVIPCLRSCEPTSLNNFDIYLLATEVSLVKSCDSNRASNKTHSAY